MLAARLSALQTQVVDALVAQGYAREHIDTQAFLNLRYDGTDSAIMTPMASPGPPQAVGAEDIPGFEAAFVQGYRRDFGFVLKGRRILVDDVRVRASGRNKSVPAVAASVEYNIADLKIIS